MKNNKGLTLIELVIVLALIGILSSLLFFPILFSFENFDKQSNTVNEISTARATMELLSKEIRKSNLVSVDNSQKNDILILDDNKYYYKNENKEIGLVKKHLSDKEQFLFGGIKSINFKASLISFRYLFEIVFSIISAMFNRNFSTDTILFC